MRIKDIYITELKKAHAEHKKWLNQVRLAVSGIVNKTDYIPVDEAQTPFGIWLYTKGTICTTVQTNDIVADIEKFYRGCYEKYLEIFRVLGGKKKGFMSFWIQPSVGSKKELEVAQEYYEELVVIADALSNKLRVLEAQMSAMGDSKFEAFSFLLEPKKEEHVTTEPTKRYYYRGTIIEE